MSDFIALSNLISQILPTLKKDEQRLLRIYDDDSYVISATDYMYHMHSNFGTYKAILDGIKEALKYDLVQKYLQEEFETDSNNAISLRYSMDLLNRSVNDATSVINDGIQILIGRRYLHSVRTSVVDFRLLIIFFVERLFIAVF